MYDRDHFRRLCTANIHLFDNTKYESIRKGLPNELVFIEFRIMPHIEFIIKNAVFQLGSSFSYTIVCGRNNVNFVKRICSKISENIRIVQLDLGNITINQYNNLLYSITFWEYFEGDRILICQEDTMIFHNKIEPFLEYSYIGAPWDRTRKGGNGGFSLRNRKHMIECLQNKDRIIPLMKGLPMHLCKDNYPEDLFFSKACIELGFKISDVSTGLKFSTENVVGKGSLGGHRFWNNDPQWRLRMNTLFQDIKTSQKTL